MLRRIFALGSRKKKEAREYRIMRSQYVLPMPERVDNPRCVEVYFIRIKCKLEIPINDA